MRTFFTIIKGARGAPRAGRRADLTRASAPWRTRRWRGPRSAGGREAPAGLSPQPGWQLRLRPAAHGGLPPERYPGHRPSPAGRRHARRPRLAREQPSSRPSALSRAKITVKSAPACGLRVLRMTLRATLDSDLPRHIIAPIGWMARTRRPRNGCSRKVQRSRRIQPILATATDRPSSTDCAIRSRQ